MKGIRRHFKEELRRLVENHLKMLEFDDRRRPRTGSRLRVSADQQYKTLKGMQDILPPDIFLWQAVEQTARRYFRTAFRRSGRCPEATSVFTRSIGEQTDMSKRRCTRLRTRAGGAYRSGLKGPLPSSEYVENHPYPAVSAEVLVFRTDVPV
jgi:hypothetical protein